MGRTVYPQKLPIGVRRLEIQEWLTEHGIGRDEEILTNPE
jgi:hypothetical protein